MIVSNENANRTMTALLSIMIFGVFYAAAADIFALPFNEKAYRVFLLMQMLAVIILSIGISRSAPGRVHAALLPVGLIFSIIGDLINSRLINLESILAQQTLLSIPFFTAAHIVYLAVFMIIFRTDRKPSVPYRRIFFPFLLSIPLALGVWLVVIPSEAPPVVRWASLFYAFVVTTMMLAAVTTSISIRALGAAALGAGGVMFWISDGVIGFYLMRESNIYVQLIIWVLYYGAQLLILRTALIEPEKSAD